MGYHQGHCYSYLERRMYVDRKGCLKRVLLYGPEVRRSLRRRRHVKRFNQVKLFSNLATKLYKGIVQPDQYQSVCTKVLLDVIQISEKQVVTPPIKALLDAIKATAFAKCKPGTTREVRENDTDITSESSEEKLEIEKDLIKKEHMFTPSLLHKWDLLKRRMKHILKVYRRDIKKLKRAEVMCRRARGKMIESLEAIHEGNVRQIKEEPFINEYAHSKRCARNLRKSLAVYRRTKTLYWHCLDREFYLRRKLKEVEWQLHLEMEKRIELTIEQGLSKLRRICKRWQIPYVNGQHLSREIILLTSTRVFFTIPPQSDFMRSSATPLTFYFPKKVVSEFVDNYVGETSTQEHSQYLDAENIYVKCIETTTAKGKEDLDLQGEQIIKQKLVSMDGERAFGWTKAGMLYIKHWGFYQTSSVTRATPKYEAYFSESFIRECNEHRRFRH